MLPKSPFPSDLSSLLKAASCYEDGTYQDGVAYSLIYNAAASPFLIMQTETQEQIVRFLSQYYFAVDTIQDLGRLQKADRRSLFKENFLNYLQRWNLRCDLHLLSQGLPFESGASVMELSGPKIQWELLQAPLQKIIVQSVPQLSASALKWCPREGTSSSHLATIFIDGKRVLPKQNN